MKYHSNYKYQKIYIDSDCNDVGTQRLCNVPVIRLLIYQSSQGNFRQYPTDSHLAELEVMKYVIIMVKRITPGTIIAAVARSGLHRICPSA